MLKEKLLEDLKNSMKDKNIVRKNVIQMIRAAILQKEKDGGVELKDEEIMQIIAKEAKTIKDSLPDYEKSRLEGAMCTLCALKKGAGQIWKRE